MQDLSDYFRAMADRKRLLIVRYLSQHEEITVTDLAAKLRMSQPLISWHLRLLRKAGVVKTRRAGRQVWCSLDRQSLQSHEERLDRLLGLTKKMDDDADTQTRTLKPTKHS